MGSRGVLNSILKHKYFPHSSFFESRLRSSPSYTCRSLWGSRDILAAGSQWKLGYGNLILIMGHLWISRLDSFQKICCPNSLPQDTKLLALLNADQEWNVDLVNAKFCSLDVEYILGISLQDGERDSSVWHFERQGRFSIQSAYCGVSLLRGEIECSKCDQSWGFVWSSKVLPKVLLFAWRCVHDTLPTTVQLRRLGIRLVDGCGCCGAEMEDVGTFFSSASSQNWFGQFSGCFGSLLTMSLLAQKAGSKRSTERWDGGIGISLTICWTIWWAQNLRLF
ncbi:UNVERIFIED_CONTAM: hypothetical protein Sradi_2685300 [Sesamum radiatum]|uniref:Reverse transcriptase zinc-binding domain-containing protein n=1 Tax=Sesamum radiatum TaxID=300843 RepID=A0AAW2S7K6_SESRA